MFDQIDTDRSGTLEKSEIKAKMQEFGSLGADDDIIVDVMFNIADKDKNEKITKSEFNKFYGVYMAAMDFKRDPTHTGLIDVLYNICKQQDQYELISLKTMVRVMEVVNPQITRETILERFGGMTEFSKADMIRVMRAFPPAPGQRRAEPQTLQPLTIGQPPGFPAPAPAQTQMQMQPQTQAQPCYGQPEAPRYDSPSARGQ